MPKPRGAASHLDIGRGSFRKAFLSLLLARYGQKDALDQAKDELGRNCLYCGISGDHARLQPDLLWPEKEYGIHVVGNVVPACPTCNSNRRDEDWRTFLERASTDPTRAKERADAVTQYIRRHGLEDGHEFRHVLSDDEARLREDLDLLLFAICQGLRAKIGNPQKMAVKFSQPAVMFDSIMEVVRRHQLVP